MNYLRFAAIALSAVAFAACAEGEREETPAPASGTTRVMLMRDGPGDISVYAFRDMGGAFRYDTLFCDGWTPEGTLSVRIPGGRYKFLFVKGENPVVSPSPLTPLTTWEETAFTLRENPPTPGTYLPCGELWLQYPAAAAEKVYTLDGTDLTVPARLTRAVSQIRISLKRGYRDGDRYVEVPYTQPRSVLDEIERVELTARGTGLAVRPDACTGSATVSAEIAAADYAEIDDSGFVRLDGPFVLPPAQGSEIALDLTVVHAPGSGLQPAHLALTGTAERNRYLDVTLWITSGYPVIGVEIRVAPIDREQEGDSGIWE